jgi:hypothetical protein
MQKLIELFRNFDQWGERRFPWFSKHYLKLTFAILALMFLILLIV